MRKLPKEAGMVIQTRDDLLVSKMRTRGVALMDEIMDELESRDFSEVRTKDLMEFAIKLTGIYVPRPKPEATSVTKNVLATNINDVLGKIGLDSNVSAAEDVESEVVETKSENINNETDSKE